MSKYSIDRVWQIWDDSCGTRVEVGPDGDGLNLVEVRYRDEEGQIGARITMRREQAELLRVALTEMLNIPEEPIV